MLIIANGKGFHSQVQWEFFATICSALPHSIQAWLTGPWLFQSGEVVTGLDHNGAGSEKTGLGGGVFDQLCFLFSLNQIHPSVEHPDCPVFYKINVHPPWTQLSNRGETGYSPTLEAVAQWNNLPVQDKSQGWKRTWHWHLLSQQQGSR